MKPLFAVAGIYLLIGAADAARLWTKRKRYGMGKRAYFMVGAPLTTLFWGLDLANVVLGDNPSSGRMHCQACGRDLYLTEWYSAAHQESCGGQPAAVPSC